MKFAVFGTQSCKICEKAKQVLTRLGCEFTFTSVNRDDYDLNDDAQRETLMQAIQDFAWYDWTDTLPLVVMLNRDDAVLARWTGKDVASREKSWLVQVRLAIEGQKILEGVTVIGDEPPELPTGV